MRKIIFSLAAIVSCFSISYSQTSVPGGNVSGTWTLAGSPYLINGSIQIPNGQTLTIEPGVTVNFQGSYKLYVQGRILAIGTVGDTITFTASDTTTGWKGIRFDNTPTTNDSSKFFYCKVQYGRVNDTDYNGGAFYFNNFSKTIISYCSISFNYASNYGGGIYCFNSNPIIINNSIYNNSNLYDGGGIYCDNSSPILNNNNIFNNRAVYGGGIYCDGGNLIISNNIILNNYAYSDFSNGCYGGGIYCTGCVAKITNNTMSNNFSYSGGGIYCSSGEYEIINNRISNNSGRFGGGVSCSGYSLIISNNTISNNTASYYGGGIYCSANEITVISNNIVFNNTALYGGGITFSSSNSELSNNTISNNSASNGGALYFQYNSDPSLKNNNIWGNTASTSGMQIYLEDENSDPNFYYCNIQGGSSAFELNGNFYTGTYQNNLDSDPLFTAPTAGSGTSYDGTTTDWSLQDSSPCINAGTPDTTGLNLPSTDITGNPRVSNGRIDIGAYENLGTSINNLITDNSINIYPNPNNGNFLLFIKNSDYKDFTIQIFDITGNIVFSENYKNKSILAENIDISEFGSGVYSINISCGSESFHENIVVLK